MRGVTSVIVQTHQILRLPRKMTLMIDPCHKWNVIYNARGNMCHSPNSPNTAPATKNDRPKYLLKTAETSFPMRGRSEHDPTISDHDPRMIRPWSEHDPTMKPSVRNPPRDRGYFSRPPRAFCIEKYNISRSGYHSKFHRILRLPRKVTLELHQILRLPRKVTLIIDPLHTWNVISNARSNKCHCPNSPNTAPATKNESHDWSLSHETLFTMRGVTSVIVQTHQILRLPRKMNLMIDPCHKLNVIYNARSNMCHSPNSPNIAPATKNDRPKSQRNLLKTAETSFPMRGRSEHDPTMIRAGSDHETVVRNPPRNRGYFSRPPRAFCIEKYNILRSGYHSKFHRILRLPRKVTLQLQQILRLPPKVTLIIDPLHIWNVIYNARSNKCHCPNSPNTAPATKNESHDWPSYYLTELLLDWAIIWLSYYLTELWLDWAITGLSYYLTELLLDWATTWLSFALTELLLDWAIELRSHSYIGSFSAKLPLIMIHYILLVTRFPPTLAYVGFLTNRQAKASPKAMEEGKKAWSQW